MSAVTALRACTKKGQVVRIVAIVLCADLVQEPKVAANYFLGSARPVQKEVLSTATHKIARSVRKASTVASTMQRSATIAPGAKYVTKQAFQSPKIAPVQT